MDNKYYSIIKILNAKPATGNWRETIADIEDIHSVESSLGYDLPDDYRNFLIHTPAIEFDGREFNVPGGKQDLIYGSIYGFHGYEHQNNPINIYNQVIAYFGELDSDGVEWYPGLRLVRDVPDIMKTMGWPRELLPIGYDMQGNEICLSLYGLRPGAIFYFVSNPIEGRQNLYLIADSFDAFMHMISSEE